MTSKLTSEWMLNPRVNWAPENDVRGRTTSFIAYLGVLVAIAVMALLVGDNATENGAEPFEYPAPRRRGQLDREQRVPSPPLYIWPGYRLRAPAGSAVLRWRFS